MVTPKQFNSGMAIYLDGVLHQVLDYEHSRRGRGGAFVRTRLRNLETGKVQRMTFGPEDDFKQAILEKRPAQFLYSSDQFYVFMDMETYDQIELSPDTLADKIKFLEEKMELQLQYCDEKPLGISLPAKVELTVAETTPGVRGNTVQGGTKKARTSSGLELEVPLFINQGERIIVDTKNSKYVGKSGD